MRTQVATNRGINGANGSGTSHKIPEFLEKSFKKLRHLKLLFVKNGGCAGMRLSFSLDTEMLKIDDQDDFKTVFYKFCCSKTHK
jgi:Fe-S cluster assembly iron-binding protein IscA